MDVIPYESGSLYILIVHIMIIIVSIRTHDGSGFRLRAKINIKSTILKWKQRLPKNILSNCEIGLIRFLHPKILP